jgi:hypothetical protein
MVLLARVVVGGGEIGLGLGLGLVGVRGMLMILIRMMGSLRLGMGRVRGWILMRGLVLVLALGTVVRRGCWGGSLEITRYPWKA